MAKSDFSRRKMLQAMSLTALSASVPGLSGLNLLRDARDIASVVTFLASPKAAAINGDVIAAAGGVRGSIYY